MIVTCPHCNMEFALTPLTTPDSPLGRARAAKGMSIQGVVKAIGGGLSVRQLSRLERGLGSPRMDIARRLSSVYGLTLEELFPVAGVSVDPVVDPDADDEPVLDPDPVVEDE